MMRVPFTFIPASRNRSVFLAMAVIGIQKLLQVAGTLITIPLILHALGEAEFGIWGAATSLVWLGGMLDLGLGAALITLIVQGMAAQNATQVRDQITAAFLGATGMAVLVSLCGAALVCFSTAGNERLAFLIAVIGLAVNIPLSLAGNIWMGLQKSHVAGGWDMAQVAFAVSVIVWATSAHAGAAVMIAIMYGSFIVANAFSLIHLMLAYPQLRPKRLRVSADIWRQIMVSGGLLTAISVAICLCYAFDNVLTLAYLGPVASAQMAIALRIGVTAIGIVGALTQPLWAAFADAHHKDEHLWVRRTLTLGTLAMAVICIAGGGVLILFGQSLLRWWLHSDLGMTTTLLWAIALWIFALSVPRIAGLLLNGMSLLRFHLTVCIATCIVAWALKLFWMTKFEVIGILLATPVSWILIFWPAFFWKIRRWWRESI